MIEAVGWEYLDAFFERCAGLLATDGADVPAGHHDRRPCLRGGEERPQLRQYADLPRRLPPSLGAMQRSVARRTDLRAVFLEDIGPSYALTLRHWRERFGAAAEQLEELGYDDRFRRLWWLTSPSRRPGS